MLATIHDDTWNVLNMQHITPNSKRGDYSGVPGGGHKNITGPAHMAEGGHHLRKAPHPHPLASNVELDVLFAVCLNIEQTVNLVVMWDSLTLIWHYGIVMMGLISNNFWQILSTTCHLKYGLDISCTIIKLMKWFDIKKNQPEYLFPDNFFKPWFWPLLFKVILFNVHFAASRLMQNEKYSIKSTFP